MTWKCKDFFITFARGFGQTLARIAAAVFPARRQPALLGNARELVVGVTMAVLPGCAFLTFVDEQDAGTFQVTKQKPDEKTEGCLPEGVTVEVERATWWATEVRVDLRIHNGASEPLEFVAPGTALTFQEPIDRHYVRTPEYCTPGEGCLLSEVGLQIENGAWRKVRPYGDVLAARRAAQSKASRQEPVLDPPLALPPGKTAVVSLEFVAPRMQRGTLTVGFSASGSTKPAVMTFELQRPA